MAILNTKLKCPQCPSSDAYTEYDNGFYCFSCKYTRNKEVSELYLTKGPQHRVALKTITTLPLNFISTDLPLEVVQWYFKCGLTLEAITRHGLGASKGVLQVTKSFNIPGTYAILPVCHLGHMSGYQARGFSGSRSKYVNIGSLNHLLYFDKNLYGPTVVVEDIMSALRISDIGYNVICVMGTHLSNEKLVEALFLGKICAEIIIWLDSDVPGQKAAQILREKFKWITKCKIIQSTKDPKLYSNDEIRRLIDSC